MILCTISQFSCVLPYLGASLIADYHITSDEFEFIQLIHNYETRQNDEDLVRIIDQYERIYPQINTPRLVALKLLNYHYTAQPLPFDPTLLPTYKQQVAALMQNKLHLTPTLTANRQRHDHEEIVPDPMIQVASGVFLHE